MSRAGVRRPRPLATGFLMAFLVPPAVFVIVGARAGMGAGGALAACAEQYVAARTNLALLGLVGCVPLVLLGMLLRLARRALDDPARRAAVAWSGVLPALAVQVWAHASYWRLFLPEREPPPFPHGLEFVLTPMMHAPVAMLVCVTLTWLLTRTPRAA
ncbi:MAG: hypothetical protein H6828_06985 [Planctomycetes bacterium]|nr:hypothetical protein [Planctomycetota bacterium]